jgi:hypothetical protein
MTNMQSETVVADAPVASDTWTAIGTITVPAGVSSLKKVLVGLVPDAGAAAVALCSAPVVRLLGSGLLEQSPHEYVCQGVDIAIIAAAGYAVAEPDTFEYDVDIPVAVGGTIDVQINSLADVMPGTSRGELVFSEASAGAANQMSQYINAERTATPDVWAAVGTITIPRLDVGKSPSRITEIAMGVVTDAAATAVSERTSARFRMSGSGIAEGGSHEFLATGSGGSAHTTGCGVYDRPIVRRAVDIPINSGGQILVEQMMDSEVPDGGEAVFGVMYA